MRSQNVERNSEAKTRSHVDDWSFTADGCSPEDKHPQEEHLLSEGPLVTPARGEETDTKAQRAVAQLCTAAELTSGYLEDLGLAASVEKSFGFGTS